MISPEGVQVIEPTNMSSAVRFMISKALLVPTKHDTAGTNDCTNIVVGSLPEARPANRRRLERRLRARREAEVRHLPRHAASFEQRPGRAARRAAARGAAVRPGAPHRARWQGFGRPCPGRPRRPLQFRGGRPGPGGRRSPAHQVGPGHGAADPVPGEAPAGPVGAGPRGILRRPTGGPSNVDPSLDLSSGATTIRESTEPGHLYDQYARVTTPTRSRKPVAGASTSAASAAPLRMRCSDSGCRIGEIALQPNSKAPTLPEDTLLRVADDHLPIDQLGKLGAGQSPPTHSRHAARAAAMITGPRKRPTNPNDCSPPRIPISASRKGSRVEDPMSAG